MKPTTTLLWIAAAFVFGATSGFGQDANVARLDQFVGSWGGYSGKTTAISGKIDLTSAFLDVVVKKTAPGVIDLQGGSWGVKATLKYDRTSAKYLISWSAENFPAVVDVPLQFSEPAGFSGNAPLTWNGKQCQAEATIKPAKDGGTEWSLVVTEGKDRWSLRLGLGKDKT